MSNTPYMDLSFDQVAFVFWVRDFFVYEIAAAAGGGPEGEITGRGAGGRAVVLFFGEKERRACGVWYL
jgi:hypothetical protein